MNSKELVIEAGRTEGQYWLDLWKYRELQIYMPGFLLSLGFVILLLISGIWYFRRMERTFADVI